VILVNFGKQKTLGKITVESRLSNIFPKPNILFLELEVLG
jgi:hypothetical protein